MGSSNFIQRVTVTIEAGMDEAHVLALTPMHGGERITAEIDSRRHYRDERAIAAALRKLAKQIERGCYFAGQDGMRYGRSM